MHDMVLSGHSANLNIAKYNTADVVDKEKLNLLSVLMLLVSGLDHSMYTEIDATHRAKHTRHL